MVMGTLLISAGITGVAMLGRVHALAAEPDVGQQTKTIVGTGSGTSVQVLEDFLWQKVLPWIYAPALFVCVVGFVVACARLAGSSIFDNPRGRSMAIIGMIACVIAAVLMINAQPIIAIAANQVLGN